MRLVFVIIFTIFLVLQTAIGQVSMKFSPESGSVDLHREVDYIKMEFPDLEPRNIVSSDYPLIAGYTIPFKHTIEKVNCETSADIRIWRIGITIAGAEGLNIYFDNFNLADGDRLFIYDPGRENLLGAFTRLNNDQFVGTGFLPGDSLVIEYNTNRDSYILPFTISEIGISTKPIGKSSRDFGDSGPCEVLVNCPEGDDFQDEKRGIARVLVKEGSSLFWCSGSLVNNTNRDGTPYFITAHHCGEDASEQDYSQWIFYFDFESLDCEMPVFEPEHKSISGATLIADGRNTSSGSDFKLLLLGETIPDSYKPYFNGWDRSTTPSPNGKGIHHPDGDLKMISTYTDPLYSSNYNNTTPDENGHFWHVVWSVTESGHGVTEGGSSGSPIFTPDGYIVGTLSGGKASCSNLTKPDYYGKFNIHWDGNGSDSVDQLKPWLDPIGSDVPSLRGLDLDSSNIKADFDSNNPNITIGAGVQFTNKSIGDIDSYKWEFTGGEPEFAETETPPLIYYYQTGEFDVKLTVKSAGDTDSLVLKNYIRVVPNVYPNPSVDGKFNITFGKEIPSDLDVQVSAVDGRLVHFELLKNNENSIIIDIAEHPQGIYVIYIIAEGKSQVIKVGNKTFTPNE